MAIFRSSIADKDDPLIKIEKLRNFYYFNPFVMNDENLVLYVSEMNRLKMNLSGDTHQRSRPWPTTSSGIRRKIFHL